MMILAATIIFLGLVINGYIQLYALREKTAQEHSHHFEFQVRQQKHEVEFAKQQAELFRKETKRKATPLASQPVGSN